MIDRNNSGFLHNTKTKTQNNFVGVGSPKTLESIRERNTLFSRPMLQQLATNTTYTHGRQVVRTLRMMATLFVFFLRVVSCVTASS